MLKSLTVRVTIAAILAGISVSAHAIADSPKTVDIPAGELRQALLQVSEQFGTDLVYSPEQVQGLRTAGAHGQLTTEQALAKLLEGTSLELRTDRSGAMLIAPPAAPSLDSRASTNSQRPQSVRVVHLAQVDATSTAQGAGQEQPAAAAPEQDGSQPQLQEVIVTGTRIQGQPAVGATVQVLTQQDITAAGAQSALDLVTQLPQNFNFGISKFSNVTPGGSLNITRSGSVNIFGLGPYATLTLMNSRRLVPQGTLGLNVDPEIIPAIAVSQIEVMADGSSAIYGSDAVAGVANIILRRSVKQPEVKLSRGFGANGYDQRSLQFIVGHDWASGRATLAYQNAANSHAEWPDYYRANLTDEGGGDYRSVLCRPGNIVVGGVSYAIPASGVTAANRDALQPNTRNLCDYSRSGSMLPKEERHAVALTFDQDLSERVSIFADVLAGRRRGDALGNVQTATLTVPSTNAFFVAPPGLNPTSETVQIAYEGLFPQATTKYKTDYMNITVGGEVKLPRGWLLSADAIYGENYEASYTLPGASILSSALSAALASNNPDTALNVFGGPTNPAVISNILTANVGFGPSNVYVKWYDATLSGPLFELPAGEASMAVGYQHTDWLSTLKTLSGTITSPRTVASPKAEYSVDSVFVETRVPLVSRDMEIPLVRQLELSAALRHDNYHYGNVDATTNPKIGVQWEPLEGLKLHAVYGTSFRAPPVFDLFGTAPIITQQTYQGPGCPSSGCIGVRYVYDNPNLQPEEARTYTFGFNWQPSFLSHAQLTADYFDIEYKGLVQRTSTNLNVLNQQGIYAGTGVISALPQFGGSSTQAEINALVAQAAARASAFGLNLPTLPANPQFYHFGTALNLGKEKVSGINFDARVQLPTDNWGTFRFGLSGLYFFEFQEAVSPRAPLIDYVDTIFHNARLRGRGTVGWSAHGLDVVTFVNYTGGYQNNLSARRRKVDDFATVDLNVSYELGAISVGRWAQGLQVGLNVRDLFDPTPPFVDLSPSAGGGGFDITAAGSVVLGRVVTLDVSKAF